MISVILFVFSFIFKPTEQKTKTVSSTCALMTKQKHYFVNPGPRNPEDYDLICEDNFLGNTLNTKLWTYYPENITRGFAREIRSNVEVSNGTLKIYSRKRINPSTHDTSYSAGFITTESHINQKYGFFEIRAKVTSQIGPHCAFWLYQNSVGTVYPTPNPAIYGTEIDIFEYRLTAGIDNLNFGLHWNGYDNANGSQVASASSAIPGIGSNFHTFALEWTPKEYIIYVDGNEKQRTSVAVSHIPEYLILSTEINGYGGNPLYMSHTMPDVFEIDYLRIYARKPSVTIYGAADYVGWTSSSLMPGTYTTAQLAARGIVNNEASSIEVPAGWVVTAFDGDNFTGDSVRITVDTRNAGGFNDRLSSLRITAPKMATRF